MSENVIYTLLIVGLLSILGFVGDRIFQKTGVPDVLLLLLVGTFIGPFLGWIDPDQLATITPYFGTLVLIFILFDGGLELDFDIILKQFFPVMVLVLLSIITVMGGVVWITMTLYDWHWLPSLLLASFLANTSGAIVLPVVNRLALKEEDKSILKLEGAASDVLVILLFVTFMSLLQAMGTEAGTSTFSPRDTLSKLTGSFSIAIVIGSLSGSAWMVVLNRIYRVQHNYMATLGMMLMLYSISEFLGASGMMAVLFFGIVLANSTKFGYFFNIREIRYTAHGMKHLHTTFSFLLRTFFLIYIGFFLSAEMLEVKFLKMGLLIVGMLVFVRLITGYLFSRIFRKDRTTTIAVISMLPRGLAVAALAAAPGQEVERMLSERDASLQASYSIVEKIKMELAETKKLKEEAEINEDDTLKDKLTKKEIKISAKMLQETKTAGGDEQIIRSLREIKKSTDSFILFAPLSILITNILMTIGCLFIKGGNGERSMNQGIMTLSDSAMLPAEEQAMLPHLSSPPSSIPPTESNDEGADKGFSG